MQNLNYTYLKLPKSNIMTVNVQISDTDMFKDMIRVFKDIIQDDRIHRPVRMEYKDKLEYIVDKY